MIVHTEGFIIHQVKYGETSAVVQIFTEKHGMVKVMLHGARGKKSKAAMLIPLSKVDLIYYRKANGSLYQTKEIRICSPFVRITSEPERIAQMIFITEILHKLIKEEEQNEALFEYLNAKLFLYDAQEMSDADFHIHFLYDIAKFTGIQPLNNIDAYDEKYFNIQDGCFQTLNQANCLDLHVSETIYLLSNRAATPKLTNQLRKNVLRGLLQYFYIQFPAMGKIKSHEVLEKVFQ